MLDELKESGLSGELTEKIDMFLTNGPLSHAQAVRVVELMMLAYVEGNEGRLKNVEKGNKQFMSEFHKKLSGDGLDFKDTEATPGS